MSLLPRTTKPFLSAGKDANEDAKPRKMLRVYGMSDIHLNNHHHPDKIHSSPYRPKVIQFLDEIIKTQEIEAAEVLLILNGDIFDITGSWPDHNSPTTMSTEKRIEVVRGIIDQIVDSNPEVIKRLRQFLNFKDTRILYIVGNHDRWLDDRDLEVHLRRILDLGPDSPRFVMTRRFFMPEIGLLALHGDEFDPACRPPKEGFKALNRAERLDMIFLNGLMDRVSKKMKAGNYPPAIVNGVQETIQALEYVRPLHHAIDYLYGRLALLKNLPESQDHPEHIDETILDVVIESLAHAFQKPTPSWLDKLGMKALLKFLSFRVGQRCLHFYISRARTILKDSYQINSVRQLIESESFEVPVRIVYLGHTHRLLFQEMVYTMGFEMKSCLIINAGGHKKTIFYPNTDEIYPAGMMAIEYSRNNEALIANLETNTRRLFLNKNEDESIF